MRVLDPGHRFELDCLDGDGRPVILQFAKRIGDHYPGNQPPSIPGTTSQEVWRVALELLRSTVSRGGYVNGQIACAETEAAGRLIEAAILLLEIRAKRVKSKTLDAASVSGVVEGETCPVCGHVSCTEEGHPSPRRSGRDG